MVTLTLPFPPSQNRIWRLSGTRVHRSNEYNTWEVEAAAAYFAQRKDAGDPILGHFTYHIVLDEKRRKIARDGDNRQKAVLDFLQHAGLIKDDRFADAGSWSWGPIEPGTCFVRIYPKIDLEANHDK